MQCLITYSFGFFIFVRSKSFIFSKMIRCKKLCIWETTLMLEGKAYRQ